MSNDERKKYIMIGSVVAILLAAVLVYYIQTRPKGPDDATKAAQDRNAQIEAGMKSNQPATPELPVDQRSPRGMIKK